MKKSKKDYSISKRFIENPRDLTDEFGSSNEGEAIENGMFLNQKHLEETYEKTRTERFTIARECKCCNKPIDKGGHYCPPCAMGRCTHRG